MKKSIVSFTSTIFDPQNNLWKSCIWVEKRFAKTLIDGEDKRVVCTLNKTISYQAALMPLGDGNFFIMINATNRRKLKLNTGDEVFVELKKDESEYGLPMPEEFKEILTQDIEGNDIFHKLTSGKQRTLLFIVGKPKSPDLRIRNGIAVLEHLKRNKGEIDYKQLRHDMKNTY